MILVSGAPGNVGTELVKLLAARGHQVRVLIRRPEAAERLPFSGVETVFGDLTDCDSLERSLAGVDRVFVNSAVGPAILAQTNLVDAAKRAAVDHIVKLSWIGASEHLVALPFGRWHAEVESYLKASGVAYTILRASAFMQNHLSHITTPLANTVYGAAGEGKAGFVDARDVAAVAASVLTESGHEGKLYEVTGPEALSNAAVAAIISKVTGRHVRAVNVSLDQLTDNYVRLGWPDAWAQELVAIQELRAGGHLATVTDVVERVAGKKSTTFEEFVRELVVSSSLDT
jgi:uncharacterized protein YbjT (DUF2867 family)